MLLLQVEMGTFKQWLKGNIFRAMNLLGAGKTMHRNPNTIILNYHHIIPDASMEENLLHGYSHRVSSFRAHIKWLAAHFENSILFDKSGAYVITFDDCSTHTFEQALPILNEFGIKAYFYVVEGAIGSQIWIDRYFLWLSYVPFGHYSLLKVKFEITDKAKTRLDAHHKLWSLYEGGVAIKDLLHAMGTAFPFEKLETHANRLEKRLVTIDREQIEQLKDQGHYVGFHSQSHQKLSLLNSEQLALECAQSNGTIYNSASMAIPFGGTADYSAHVVDHLKQVGHSPILLNHSTPPNSGIFGRLNLPDTRDPNVIEYHVRRHLTAIS